jgi:pyrroline-5-carboxylate reductase
MPNMPAWVDEGASVLFANDKAQSRLEMARLILLAVGQADIVEDEGLIDAATAVSGSGPAYFFLLLDRMIDAAIELGLPEDIATSLVLQTGKGACMLAEKVGEDGESPADLVKRVATPGGTTEAAFNVLKEGNFGLVVNAAIKKACQRSRELSHGN